MHELLLLTATGLLAGTLGGLLGVGGGVLLMPMLRFGIGLTAPQAIGTCVAAVFCTTLGGSWAHHRLGNVPVRFIVPVFVTAAVSVTLCSLLFVVLSPRSQWLDLGIAGVFTLVSARMIFDGAWHLRARPQPPTPDQVPIAGQYTARKIGLGVVSGVLPGLFGIGTGAILVPGFTYLLRTSMPVAIGSALTCFALSALLSTLFKLAQGYLVLSAALPICLGTLAGSQLGARLGRRFSAAALKLLFGLVFSWVSYRFFTTAIEGMS
ncbi:MAG: sulfite exporter TauE/SafE family protein [Pseudomonadota bacterium]